MASKRGGGMQSLLIDDFFTGLFSALAARGLSNYTVRGELFDHAVEEVSRRLIDRSKDYGVKIRFRIRTHAVHKDSEVVRDALASAAQRGVISLDNPEFVDMRIKLSRESALKNLKELPGGEHLYEEVADDFLRVYA